MYKGNLTKDALSEYKNLFFSIRVWDQDDIIKEIAKNYDKFDDELKAELLPRRIWTFVEEDLE